MIKLLRGFCLLGLGAAALSTSAAAQGVQNQSAATPVCARLQGQLAAFDRAVTDSARADLIKHAEDAVAKQQADLDRTVAQSRRDGCEGIGGFFALFTGQSPQCAPLNSQIQQMRGNLDRMMSDLERLKSSNNDQQAPRRALIEQLAQNNCGPQYRAAAAAAGPGGLLDALFGGSIIPGGEGAPSGTYRTVCVRTCDGYYFPISYSTVPDRFAEDQRTCQRLCPATEAVLYTYRNPGEDIGQAVTISGQPYMQLPNAFRYRREFTPSCSCRRPGQSWADALKNTDDSTTLESGDIVVTDDKAKALSQVPKTSVSDKHSGKAGANKPDQSATSAGSATANAANSDTPKGPVRTVGPPFIPGQ